MDRPVKIQCVETGRFLPGHTCDVSPGGAMIEVKHPSLLVPGQRVRVGISWTAQQMLLHADDMAEATVLRSLGQGGTQHVAIGFDQPQSLSMAG